MKKNLLVFLIFLLPFIACAQDNAGVVKDFFEGAHSIPTSFILNDHVNILQINADNENFVVMAIDNQMQVLWKTTLKGYVVKTAKFKNKILAVAATDYSMMKGTGNTYIGYILDPATGNVTVQTTIYDGPKDNTSIVKIFTGEGDFFKFAIRQTGMEHRVQVISPITGIFLTTEHVKQLNDTKDLNVIEFNDRLEAINVYKPDVDKGTFMGWNCNKQGDLFIGWLNDNKIGFIKYDNGKKTPSANLSADIQPIKDDNDVIYEFETTIQPSEQNSNSLYYGILYKNLNKEMELGLGKVDFQTAKKNFISEEFTKDHIKTLQKAFVPVNQDLKKPDLGSIKGLRIKNITEADGQLVVALASNWYFRSGTGNVWQLEGAILLNGYDTDLNLKYQQLVPTGYASAGLVFPTGYYANKSKLFIIAAEKKGADTFYAAYCVLDVESGKWDKMELLPKKSLKDVDFAAGSSVLWFPNNFIVPYLRTGMIFFSVKYHIALQQNAL